MSAATFAAPTSIDPSDLLPPLRRLFASDDIALLDWEGQALRGAIGWSGASVGRLCGHAQVASKSRPWTLIRKRLAAPKGPSSDATDRAAAPSFWMYWKRDYLYYHSGLSEQLPAGLAAPRCYHAEEDADGRTLWLEEVHDELPVWPLERYGLAARHLGCWNGLYLTERPTPDHPWFTTDIQRDREEGKAAFYDHLYAMRQHDIVRRGFPEDVAVGMLRLWNERERFYGALAELPRMLQHRDATRKNLMSRTRQDGAAETVAIDWGLVGVGALGEDMAGLVLSVVLWFQGVTPAQLPELEAIVLAGYLEGLAEAGWRGDPDLAWLGYLCTAALRFGPMMAIPEWGWLSLANKELMKQRFAWTIEEWADQLREMRRFVIQRADQARRLMAQM